MSERDREEQAKALRLLRFSHTSTPEAVVGSAHQPRSGCKLKHLVQEFQLESNVETKRKEKKEIIQMKRGTRVQRKLQSQGKGSELQMELSTSKLHTVLMMFWNF
ncbi:hypothetical protein O6H91_05G112400 [Diphasiastrum complanatum]|uniref:Uncharacterized protein n=1 Tax=Diphasiastrum complanatum TaxID=34168 RepID=A0ACC2DSB0_DIPCM|nr:hypothetical protein O6H91_05G112400 [Diphasiastrum complanatum]